MLDKLIQEEMRNFNEYADNRDKAICIVFTIVTIVMVVFITGVAHFIYSENKIDEQRLEIRQNRDTIHQLRLQVIELESEAEIKNHWEE